ncbi:MAG: histidine kinase, partial [Bacteroidetes bacterium]|nr:histidine kinase [Bacteroidota bacterium]
MDNPFLKSAKLLLIYISMWMLITLAHFSVIYFFYSFELNVVITDSLLFNLTYALLGLSIWYVVNYNEPLKSINFNTFLNLLTFATILLFVWIYTCNGLLHIFFSDNADYLNFLNRSLSWRVLTGIFLNVILTLIYYVIIYYSDMQERSLREAKLKEMIRISELNILKSQINPHFLFNSLNSISSFTITNPDKAREMIIKLSNFLRYSISQSEIKLTTLGSELENMRRYLDIEQVRFGNRLNQIFEIDPHCNEKEIPTMILQPIYENAV